ncbi:hypothetical protein JCM11251_004878 [Rhodosporidiobolus azoricus]
MATVWDLINSLTPAISPHTTSPPDEAHNAISSWEGQSLPAAQTPTAVSYLPNLAALIVERVVAGLEQRERIAQKAGAQLPSITQLLLTKVETFVEAYSSGLLYSSKFTNSACLQTLLLALTPAMTAFEIALGEPRTSRYGAKCEVHSPRNDPDGVPYGTSVKDDIHGCRASLVDGLRNHAAKFLIKVTNLSLSMRSNDVLPSLTSELAELGADGQDFYLADIEDANGRTLLEKATFAVRVHGMELFVLSDSHEYLVGIVKDELSTAAASLSPSATRRIPFHLYLSNRHPIVCPKDHEPPPALLLILLAFLQPGLLDLEALLSQLSSASEAHPSPAASMQRVDPGGRRSLRQQEGTSRRGSGAASGIAMMMRRRDTDSTGYSKASVMENRLGGKEGGVDVPPGKKIMTEQGAMETDSTSSPLGSPHDSPETRQAEGRPPHLLVPLYTTIGESHTSMVWVAFNNEAQEVGVVFKIARPGSEEVVRREAGLLFHLKGVQDLATALVFPTGYFTTSNGLPVIMMHYEGNAPKTWRNLSLAHRHHLFFSILKLHQIGHVIHGDMKPYNSVVPRPKDAPKTLPLWLDLGHAEEHNSCAGQGCKEMEQVLRMLDLNKLGERARLKGMAWQEGLVWG